MGRAALLVISLAIAAVGCSKEGVPRGVDGGAFVLPDGGFRDGSVPDAEPGDAGPFACNPPCASPSVCGCLDGRPAPSCGCHAPGGFEAPCDPQVPETCASPLECVPARDDFTLNVCSDGREGALCSHALDICTTEHGCVCLTSPDGRTECHCTEQFGPDPALCDRLVPASCPGGTCVRVASPGGVFYFVCSLGEQGAPCERDDQSCRTSLGCTCPRVAGRERCQCSEPGTEVGDPCDPAVSGACVAPLTCQGTNMSGDPVTTTCQGPIGTRDAGGGGFCDPNDPLSCPPDYVCIQTANGFECVPDR